jgi:maleate cis-trans isomerase
MASLGILVIHNDPVPELEMRAMAPPDVSIHAARFQSPTSSGAEYTGTPAGTMLAEPDVARGVRQLGQVGLDAICLCFGSASFFGGHEFDRAFTEEATRIADGTPVYTAGQAVVAAMRAADVRRPLVVMPPWFTQPTYDAAGAYLGAAGVDVAGLLHFDLGPEWQGVRKHQIFDRGGRWRVLPDDVRHQVRDAFPAGADGVLIPGSGIRSAEAVEPLERDLGVPVITANKSCMWYLLDTEPGGSTPCTSSANSTPS